MSSFKWFNYFTIVFVLLSCGNPVPTLDGVDLNAWKNDKGGCKKERERMLIAIEKEKEKLLSLREAEVISLLGRPDENELYKRNQKFFYYHVEPSANCSSSPVNRPKQLIIRFNAMGLAKEVSIE
jgi:hypothetical protein